MTQDLQLVGASAGAGLAAGQARAHRYRGGHAPDSFAPHAVSSPAMFRTPSAWLERFLAGGASAVRP